MPKIVCRPSGWPGAWDVLEDGVKVASFSHSQDSRHSARLRLCGTERSLSLVNYSRNLDVRRDMPALLARLRGMEAT